MAFRGGKILGYKWCQQILGCENVKGTFNMKNTTTHIPHHPPVSTHTDAHMWVRAHFCILLASHRFLHSFLLLYKIYILVPHSLLVRGDPFSSSLYKGLCNLEVFGDFLFNKKGKMQDKLADRNPPWSQTRSQRSQCEEMMLA